MRNKKHRRSKFLFKEERGARDDVRRKVKNAEKLEARHTASEWVFIQRLED